jgi:outer membrane biosynthesis protein TonB
MGGGAKQELTKWQACKVRTKGGEQKRVASQRAICRYRFMPAPLPPDQLTIIRNLISNGDMAGAIKVYVEATGATEAEAKTEVNNLASRYGLVGGQVPDIFVRRTPPPPKPAPTAEAPTAPVPPPAPAPVAQQAANVPLEPAPVPAPKPATPPPPPPASTPVRASTPTVSGQAATPQRAAKATTPAAKKSRWGCSSVFLLLGAGAGLVWWFIA